MILEDCGAVFIASAPYPPRAGPFLVGATLPHLGSLGRCTRRIERLCRSTTVPMADRLVPMIKSPSQCPGTARSLASAGRLEMNTFSVTSPAGLGFDQARGLRKARRVLEAASR